MRENSPLYGTMRVGDRILAVDSEGDERGADEQVAGEEERTGEEEDYGVVRGH